MKFFSTFVSVGILMIFGTLLGIQLDGKPDSYREEVVSQTTDVSNVVEPESVETSSVETEPVIAEVNDIHAEKSILTKLGHGLNNVVSGISERAVSGLE